MTPCWSLVSVGGFFSSTKPLAKSHIGTEAPMVASPEIKELTKSLPARAATIVLCAPLTQGPWSAVVTMPSWVRLVVSGHKDRKNMRETLCGECFVFVKPARCHLSWLGNLVEMLFSTTPTFNLLTWPWNRKRLISSGLNCRSPHPCWPFLARLVFIALLWNSSSWTQTNPSKQSS